MIEVDARVGLRSGSGLFTLETSFASASRRVVIFGASGSGKSVTLRLMAGLMRPDAGRVVLDGEVVFDSGKGVDVPPRKRRIGFVFQDYALFPQLTVRANVAFGLRRGVLAGLFSQKEDPVVEELLERLEIRQVAGSLPGHISGGQRQRTALARALATRPRALFLDEPLSALDPLLRVRLRNELSDILDHLDIPCVMITHDPDDVERFAQTLVLYKAGRVSGCLDYAGLRQRDESPYAALERLYGSADEPGP